MDKLKRHESFLQRMSDPDTLRPARDQLLISLPPPARHDAMFERKEDLLNERGLTLIYDLKTLESQEITDAWLGSLLEAARILQLTETEWYFVEDGDRGPFSPRNEIEALRAMELQVRGLLTSVGASDARSRSTLAHLHNLILSRLNAFNRDSSVYTKEDVRGADENMANWAAAQGIKSLIRPADFKTTGRGAAASTKLETGDLVLEIPQELLISEDVALRSHMGPAFKDTPGLSGETMALLWTMSERYNKKSKFAPFFTSLPESFHTGLGFGVAGLQALEGTLVFEEILQAREHLRTQYDSIIPPLSLKYPDLFPEACYSWEQYLWACQLWYSYGMKVKFPRGTVQTCLVPMASLLNHAIFPHVTHFSRINESTDTLQLFALRTCNAREQCFLSYGALSNSDLLTFYGFVIEQNPYDVIPIDLDLLEICQAPEQVALIEKFKVLSSHTVRGFHSLPTRLIAALRVACMEEDDFTSYFKDPRLHMVNARNEHDVFESLLSTVDSLLEPLQGSDVSGVKTNDNTLPWDVLLAEHFKHTQRIALESVKEICVASLASL